MVPWAPATIQLPDRRKKGPGSCGGNGSTAVTDGLDLVLLESTRNGLHRKRKMDGRDEDDGAGDDEVAPDDGGEDGGKVACQGTPERLFGSDHAADSARQAARSWEERSGHNKDQER